MRLLLLGNYAPDRQESMLRYASLLQRELTARGHQVRLLQPTAKMSRALPLRGAGAKWLGYADKFLLFPGELRRVAASYDVVHLCDHSNAMYTKDLQGKPNVVTCHDVLAISSALGEVPENPVSATGKRLQAMILSGLKRAQYVVAISHRSQAEMLRLTGRPAESSTVVHNSLAYAYTPMPREEALARLSALGYSGVQPFFLHVGSDAWYKNRLGLLRIFDRLHKRRGCTDARLLLIGSALDDKLNRYIRRKGLENRVTRLSGLSNEDLRAAYSLAQALIFPSLTEGFGWPVLEAQACGCPVFTTGREPMTEVGGTAAVYFDPEEPAAAAAMIVAKLPQRGEMAAAGFENLQGFSVGQMIDGYERAYRHVLGQV